MKRFAAGLVLLTALSAPACGETWTVVTSPVNPTASIIFTFANGGLTVNRTFIGWGGPPGYVYYGYELVGNWDLWGACGTYESDGTFAPDPYAVYVPEVYGLPRGHVEWAPGTPQGYQVTLNIGSPGSPSPLQLQYSEEYPSVPPYLPPPTDLYHTFTATYIPEPSSLLALAAGIGAMGMVVRRRRR